MKHVYKIGLALVLYLVAVFLFRPSRMAPPLPEATHATSPTSAVSASRGSSQWQLETRLTEERVSQLTAMVRRNEQVQAAAEKMIESRRQAQVAAYPAWKQILASHQAAYAELQARARQAPHGETPCTLCDGTSYMPCAMCLAHDGHCVTCRGTGHLRPDTLCPTCVGNGKCYLCSGSGKMFCPFCNDGMIEAHRPPPPNFPPLE